ncbi:MAG: hypothetical protein P4L69_18005 [Desulfosporosinus sp.]|nr:hypothetical protein [Desulfosporosinus sp.]
MIWFKFGILGAMFVVLMSILITGCSSQHSEGVQFKNEVQLEQEGFVCKLVREVYLGDDKVLFQKVAYDRNAMTFVYKGGKTQLIGSVIMVNGMERQKPQKVLEHMDQPQLPFGTTTYSGNDNYHVITVSHNLKLVQQQVAIEININGRDNKFNINFPGDKLAASTAEVMVDLNGKVVDEGVNSAVRVTVGIGSTVVESKGEGGFIVLDKVGGKVIPQSTTITSPGEATTMYEPLPLPRKDIGIRIFPSDGTVLISRI